MGIETSPLFACPPDCEPELTAEVVAHTESMTPQRMVYRYYPGRHSSHLGSRSREFWSELAGRDETEQRVYQRRIGDQWTDMLFEEGVDKTNITPMLRATGAA
jgi:hypothetical protein